MRFNPATESASRSLDGLAEQTRAVITKLDTPCPRSSVWDPAEGCWVDNTTEVARWHLNRLTGGLWGTSAVNGDRSGISPSDVIAATDAARARRERLAFAQSSPFPVDLSKIQPSQRFVEAFGSPAC